MNQAKGNDAARQENKRERRRGAAGRAAVLRRAPSDSDCSGETASLSADSGDRVVRAAPPPPRANKTRSRRRGSEWEVLEGLKDGQRFEKRPDVFNGYLHKKRKWPLKGWHKRFFVVDGGILVYARSPADVARGRLHGSVDVGLSVISAKARRRRIDIDADEFIYHLRAKTPDLFRTWLNVLKAHRLYRQHLLTFGARESAPKIHPPIDDLPATDNSSHTSITISDTSTLNSNDQPFSQLTLSPCNNESSVDKRNAENSNSSDHVPLDLEYLENKMFDLKFDESRNTDRSLCSTDSIVRKYLNIKQKKSPELSVNSTDGEQQIICTDLDLNSLKSNIINKLSSNIDQAHNIDNGDIAEKANEILKDNLCEYRRRNVINNAKVPVTTACYFFTRKKHRVDNSQSIKHSKKCTNLVKYRNLCDEPHMKMPTSKCMLLGNYQVKISKQSGTVKPQNRAIGCETIIEKSDVLADTEKANKTSQNVMTSTDYDKITEKLMISIFQKQTEGDKSNEVKFYIDKVVKDLYDTKFDVNMHPVKALFRCLLEYWLKNTSVTQFKEAMKSVKSIERQSNKHFTRDQNLSSVLIDMISKETQFHGLSDLVKCRTKKIININQIGKATKCERNPHRCHSPKRDTESFEKERRIQELERLLKNTVYICETKRDTRSREKDIKITKKLIDNLGKQSKKLEVGNTETPIIDKSRSSTELPAIQDTINHLISDTSIPSDFAKEFLGAYLDVLLNDESQSATTSKSSDWSAQSNQAVCEVQAEAVVKKVSRSVTTLGAQNKIETAQFGPRHNTTKISNSEKQLDPGQVYLKDVLDKITTIFSKVKKNDYGSKKESKQVGDKVPNEKIHEYGRPVKVCSKNNIIYENSDEKSLVIDLSKYNLEHISMFNDPTLKEVMSVTIKLKEKPPNQSELKPTHLNLKFSDDVKPLLDPDDSGNWISLLANNSICGDIFTKTYNRIDEQFIDFEANRELINLKPYSSTSDATSKAYRLLHESNHSLVGTLKMNDIIKDKPTGTKDHEDPQSCYIVSLKKGSLASKFQSKKKVKVNAITKEAITVTPKEEASSKSPKASKPVELSVFQKPTPRIIDEKFILLLLENLMLLSKNIPTLYKDINALYLKLRKRHEKIVKNCSNIQGLSLLGKIYNDESYVNGSNDKETQSDAKANTMIGVSKENKNVGTNMVKHVADKEVLTAFEKEFSNSNIQTKNDENTNIKLKLESSANYFEQPKASTSRRERITVTQTETVDIDSLDHSTSIPNWLNEMCTKDCAISTIIKYVLDKESSHKLRLTAARPIRVDREYIKKKRNSQKVRQNLINEISLLSPSFKVSTQSQTEKKLTRLGIEKLDKDFNVYQLFLSKQYGLRGSSSMSVANLDVHKSDDIKTLYRCASVPSNISGLISPTTPTLRGPQAGFVSGTPGGRLAGWIIESGGPLDTATRELGQAQLSVQQLQRLLDALELQQQVHHDTDVSLEGASPNVKKDRRKFGLRKKKSNSKCASVELAPPHIDPSSSHTALSALTAPPSPGGGASSIPNSAASLPIACAAARPQSLPGAESFVTVQGPASLTSLTPDHQLREDFTVLAKDLVASLKGVVSTLVCERSRLRAAMEAAESASLPGGASVVALRTNLTSALQQNSELRTRLSRIHDASDIAEICSVNNSDPSPRAFPQSLSYSSSCVSASEFFDAEEHEDDGDLKPDVADEAGVIELDGDSSSEAGSLSSEEGSASSDNSEGAMLSAEAVTLRHEDGVGAAGWARRTRLPTPRPAPGGPSLWNLLYKNIGKDLSQISMPVTINEPLNMLQRLCEELEYSELLDAASECKSSVERMALIAAFAVSAYAASAHRAASKPFNPLLGETYECVRDDRGFRFLAEQVSHHPPISACHAESPRWCFWQEARIKTKFWGKSMEFQPTGRVHVRLSTTGDHYTWNKVTTCVHNLFGGQRWVDQYGEMHIACVGTDVSCKLNFIKASSWSATRHEVRGVVNSRGGRLRLAGRWSEALHAGEPPAARCLWRPGAMPPEHELYYGFTRFAMELNEMEPGMPACLPHTDTRLRPDQRALEEGLVDSAEQLKHELEQAQRERRRDNTAHVPAWFRKVTEDGEETWVFTNEYWKAREAGFSPRAPRIW